MKFHAQKEQKASNKELWLKSTPPETFFCHKVFDIVFYKNKAQIKFHFYKHIKPENDLYLIKVHKKTSGELFLK